VGAVKAAPTFFADFFCLTEVGGENSRKKLFLTVAGYRRPAGGSSEFRLRRRKTGEK
jgi:hypothetical protein